MFSSYGIVENPPQPPSTPPRPKSPTVGTMEDTPQPPSTPPRPKSPTVDTMENTPQPPSTPPRPKSPTVDTMEEESPQPPSPRPDSPTVSPPDEPSTPDASYLAFPHAAAMSEKAPSDSHSKSLIPRLIPPSNPEHHLRGFFIGLQENPAGAYRAPPPQAAPRRVYEKCSRSITTLTKSLNDVLTY